eukprot:1155443-Pelagomonas_calceolata.AAC.12
MASCCRAGVQFLQLWLDRGGFTIKVHTNSSSSIQLLMRLFSRCACSSIPAGKSSLASQSKGVAGQLICLWSVARRLAQGDVMNFGLLAPC